MGYTQYDLTIIGGGSAGLTAAQVAHSLGARVLLIDKERLGGDCLFSGCVPSKSLLHVARIVHQAQTSVRSGLLAGDSASVDMEKVSQYIQEVIGRIAINEQAYTTGVDVAFGKVTFASRTTLNLDGRKITTRHTLIATGSRPAIPPLPGLEKITYLTNESVFDLQQLPASLVIIGGGPVGIELGQAFNRLGTQVTILQRATCILPREETEVSEALTRLLRTEGITIHTGIRIKEIKQAGPKKIIILQQGEQEREIAADDILIATGRKPVVTDLNLEAAGVAYTEQGIQVNDYLQTTTPNILALGDVLGGYYFTHVAAYQAGIAVRNALLPFGKKKVDYRVVPWCTFTDPEAGRLGLTETEARTRYKHVQALHFPWQEIDRAQTENERDGFIKLILAGKKQEIVGAHLIGAHAGELLGEIALVMKLRLPISAIYQVIHPYPTYSSGLQQAAFNAYLQSKNASTNRKLIRTILRLQKYYP
ncbi:mercuric reductase [Dictyobacter vulcani]|uniref:Mercuric reductase n=1 Tax=Dictyobacter vulcani TaxID=2607529 RepID=A0A5J4KFF0_9CHLR|nr:FAD-dependent oxidoreductase [Dictyobacter vulcani]GER86045.1 mercuric reductase [Dictyobacter vulcani]